MTLREKILAQAAGNAWVQAAENGWGQAGMQVTDNSRCAARLDRPLETFGRVNAPLKRISAADRHFPDCVGQEDFQILLAFPATVTASALTGRITHPWQFPPKG